MNGTHPKRGSIRGVEVRGEVLRGVIAGMGVFQTKALKLLNESGITEPRGHRWYPLESLIFVFNKLADEGGVNLLRIIGASVIQNAQWPKEIDSLSKALYSVNTSYHMNHRRDGKELFDPVLGKTIEGGIGHNVIVPPTPDQNRVLAFRKATLLADAYVATGQKAAAVAALEGVLTTFPNPRLQKRIDELKGK